MKYFFFPNVLSVILGSTLIYLQLIIFLINQILKGEEVS